VTPIYYRRGASSRLGSRCEKSSRQHCGCREWVPPEEEEERRPRHPGARGVPAVEEERLRLRRHPRARIPVEARPQPGFRYPRRVAAEAARPELGAPPPRRNRDRPRPRWELSRSAALRTRVVGSRRPLVLRPRRTVLWTPHRLVGNSVRCGSGYLQQLTSRKICFLLHRYLLRRPRLRGIGGSPIGCEELLLYTRWPSDPGLCSTI